MEKALRHNLPKSQDFEQDMDGSELRSTIFTIFTMTGSCHGKARRSF